MALIDGIERIQRASLSTRRIVLIFSVFIIMGAIISIWMAQLSYELDAEKSEISLREAAGSLWHNIREKAPRK